MAMTIRLAAESDAEQILEIYAPFCRDTPVSFETQPPTLEEIRHRIAKILKSHPWLVCEDSGLILGYAYASPHRERAAYVWSVDVSVYVREGRRRGGLGRALYTSLFQLLKLQGFYTALAGTTVPNPGSIGLHRAMGFELVGTYRNIGYKCGAWHDVAWWQLALQEADAEPEPPRDIRILRESAAWHDAIQAGSALLRPDPENPRDAERPALAIPRGCRKMGDEALTIRRGAMIDVVTKEPIRVSMYYGAWPYIRFPLEQLDEVKKRLDRAGFRYAVDKYALSSDGGPYTVDVHFEHRAELASIQGALDDCQAPETITARN
jgi:L-amino acid N-acyltransferase YncA